MNRIADLNILPFYQIESNPGTASSENGQPIKLKHVILNDIWQQYCVRFTLFDPEMQASDKMIL